MSPGPHPDHPSVRRRASSRPALSPTALTGLRKAATAVHAFPDTRLEVRRDGEVLAWVARTDPDGPLVDLAHAAPVRLISSAALRAGVASSRDDDASPAFGALGVTPSPLSIRLVGGPVTSTTRAGVLVSESAAGWIGHATVTTLDPDEVDRVLDEATGPDERSRLAVWSDDLTGACVVSTGRRVAPDRPEVPRLGCGHHSDACLITRVALAFGVAEVEHSVRV